MAIRAHAMRLIQKLNSGLWDDHGGTNLLDESQLFFGRCSISSVGSQSHKQKKTKFHGSHPVGVIGNVRVLHNSIIEDE